MEWTLDYLEDIQVVKVTTSGEYSLGAEPEALHSAIDEMRKRNSSKCLFDQRNATLIINTLSSVQRGSRYDEVGFCRTMRIATLANEITEELEFYKTACLNRGWQVNIFDDYDVAIKWLTK